MAAKISQDVINEGKLCALLSYLFVGLIWFAIDEHQRKNAFARFHAKEGLLLFLFYVGLQIMMRVIPFIGKFLGIIGSIFLFVLGLVGLYHALTGKLEGMPVLSELAQKIQF